MECYVFSAKMHFCKEAKNKAVALLCKKAFGAWRCRNAFVTFYEVKCTHQIYFCIRRFLQLFIFCKAKNKGIFNFNKTEK
jgi:hypothetical protein